MEMVDAKITCYCFLPTFEFTNYDRPLYLIQKIFTSNTKATKIINNDYQSLLVDPNTKATGIINDEYQSLLVNPNTKATRMIHDEYQSLLVDPNTKATRIINSVMILIQQLQELSMMSINHCW